MVGMAGGMTAMRCAAILLAAVWLAACASTPGGPNDPYEKFNRNVFDMNLQMDRTVLRPLAETYVEVVPEDGRDGVHNLLTLANLPVVFANDVLQARPKAAGQTLARMAVNAVCGLGVHDAASHMGMPGHDNDFGLTLAAWGWKDGPYLMLPMIGPSSPRDAAGFAGDIALDPAIWLQYKQYVWWLAGRKAMTILDMRAANLELLDDVERNSMDFYSASRSMYTQHRKAETGGDEPP
jgi:phospholipid-binding lipoprotein MlaA